MSSIIDKVFSDKYVNRSAVGNNYLLYLMYRFAYPFAVLLSKFHLSPNQITTQSIIFAILALFSLVYDDGWLLFVLFWGISLLLDFCDGTVARMTNNTRKTAFRYDHISDLLKINLVILGAGIRYNNELVWVASFSASFFFMYYTVLNHELVGHKNDKEKVKLTLVSDKNTFVAQKRMRDRSRIVAWIVKYKFLINVFKNTYSALVTINGHTLLIFLLMPFGVEYVIISFVYLTILSFLGCKSRIFTLISMPK